MNEKQSNLSRSSVILVDSGGAATAKQPRVREAKVEAPSDKDIEVRRAQTVHHALRDAAIVLAFCAAAYFLNLLSGESDVSLASKCLIAMAVFGIGKIFNDCVRNVRSIEK